MIIGRIVEEWSFIDGLRVRVNPICRSTVFDEAEYPGECGRSATVRVNYWPQWSMFFCPEHAQDFAEPREFSAREWDWVADLNGERDIDEPTFLRKARSS